MKNLQHKKVIISGATSGNNELVAAVAGKQIRVISMQFITADAVTVRFESSAGGTALSGLMSFPANGGMVLGENQRGWFVDSVAGENLNMELGGAIQVSGSMTYVEV